MFVIVRLFVVCFYRGPFTSLMKTCLHENYRSTVVVSEVRRIPYIQIGPTHEITRLVKT